MSDEIETTVVLLVVKRLRELRKARGVSQYRLSKETGLSPSGIRHMEDGDVSPTLFFLLRICSFLEADLAMLISQAKASVPLKKKSTKKSAQ